MLKFITNRPTFKEASPDKHFNTGDHVGIELELENCVVRSEDFRPFSTYWSVDTDGSLRDSGVEFIFTQPRQNSDISKALQDFKEFKKIHNKKYNKMTTSIRTSCHVHVNVLDLNESQLADLILLSALYEPLLYTMVGPDRYYNNNCTPIHNNVAVGDIYNTLKQMYLHRSNQVKYEQLSLDVGMLAGYIGKYSGVNISSIFMDYRGSLEYRMCEGTDNTVFLKHWVKLLLTLKAIAKDSKQMLNLIMGLESNQPDDTRWGKEVFSKLLPSKSYFYGKLRKAHSSEELSDIITKGVRSATNILNLNSLTLTDNSWVDALIQDSNQGDKSCVA